MNIICFGDSITRGYDVREGLGWVELCSAALPAYHMENHGIDGLSVQGLINYLESTSPMRRIDIYALCAVQMIFCKIAIATTYITSSLKPLP